MVRFFCTLRLMGLPVLCFFHSKVCRRKLSSSDVRSYWIMLRKPTKCTLYILMFKFIPWLTKLMQRYGITIHAGKKTPRIWLNINLKSVYFVCSRYLIVSQCTVQKKNKRSDWMAREFGWINVEFKIIDRLRRIDCSYSLIYYITPLPIYEDPVRHSLTNR